MDISPEKPKNWVEFSLDLIAVDEPPAEQSLTEQEARDIAGRLGKGTIG